MYLKLNAFQRKVRHFNYYAIVLLSRGMYCDIKTGKKAEKKFMAQPRFELAHIWVNHAQFELGPY